ncbi:MAG: polysaccharide biosynthesis tyrosine autokinase [Kiritimatiellae bacterium]|nr:polysaccharide biosynthesis tyrosine autokinase [Kiritimatiellia bacterium]MDD5520915.1 polysaccharide biosynthesis tyrosine autokinase [Kiritimatiellia bacterium]
MTEPQETLHFLDYWRVIRSRKEIIIAVFLLVVLTGILVTYSLPKVYMASTVIKVKEDSPDIEPFGMEGYRRGDPLFLRTQFEIIQSRPVREEVVSRLGLNEKLSKAYGYNDLAPEKSLEQTLKILSKSMKVQQYRDTNLIQIRIYLAEPKVSAPELAASVADEVAKVFRDQNMDRNRQSTERALEVLHKSIAEQNERVIEAEAKKEEIRKKYKISLTSSFYGSGSSIEKRTLEHLEQLRTEARMEVAHKKARLDIVNSLPSDKLLESEPYIVGDQGLGVLVTDKRKSEVDLRRLKESFGPKHPEVMSKEEGVKALDKKIEDALNGLRTGVKADYDASKAKLDSLESDLEAKKASEIKAEGTNYREFEKAEEEVDHARKIRNAMEVKYEEEKISLRIPRTMVEIVEPSKAPDKDDWVSPDFLLNIILSILVGLMAGIGLAYFIEYLDTSVKTIEDIERSMGVSVLGVIPQKVKAFVDEAADIAHSEAYRVLRTNIQFSKKLNDAKTICFTSGSVGEGKSLTLFNLAYVYAQLGSKVLIVDSDLHRPRQHKILDVSNSSGLANILVGELDLGNAIVETKVPNLHFLPSGRMASGVHGLLDTRKLKDLMKELREYYDIIFFDAPPIIGVSDASLLVREVDATMLVIQHRKYPKSVSSRARDMIENVGGNLIGVVLNNINISRDYSYYYHHYYSYPTYGESGKNVKNANRKQVL